MNNKSLHALCVGINTYQSLNKLTCPASDALDMSTLLRQSGHIQSNVELLCNVQSTKAAIMSKISQLADKASPDDTAVFFFAGHGIQQFNGDHQEAYLCPVEASLSTVAQTCIANTELTEALRAIKAGRLIVLLDACHAGDIGEPRSIHNTLRAGLSASSLSDLIEGHGRVIIAACRPDEAAWEFESMRNGLFTHYLLKGLHGEARRADGTVWVSDLFSYLSRLVRQHRLQHPYQKSIGEDFVLIAGSPPLTHSVKIPAMLIPTPLDQRILRQAMRTAYNRAELSILCKDLELSLEDLPGATLETQIMDLIDHCCRHRRYEQLVNQVITGRPHLKEQLQTHIEES